ncbi:SGNH/GDSL hydrolase family protein [Sphingobacterium spiritivorum]|uniref:SGNH/GDSL hydrolase family protein n=1 Tax=Sphingobacterium spiritivorum TaxID=258 RepID=UPI003DA222BC
MKSKPCFLLLFLMVYFFKGYGQTAIHWLDPLTGNAIAGRVPGLAQSHDYGRLPASLKEQVREPVWSLGTNSAGLFIDFQTDADSILVRYTLKGSFAMPHMPSTGVSGLDLYAFDPVKNTWNWAAGKYDFSDTSSFVFSNIASNSALRYRLYLPLYNSVGWMNIGVPEGKKLEFLKKEIKPVVVYGTSIAQGACTSRPGLAWTNMLGRHLQMPVINLGFSGNGRLEEPILNLMNTVDARVYVLDCIPNLGITKNLSEKQLDSLLKNAVSILRVKHPKTPIIITEHSSRLDPQVMNLGSNAAYTRSTMIARKAFRDMQQSGIKDLYLLSNTDIGLNLESTVDYAHPNDLGMMKIARAYEKLIKSIIH